MSLQSLFAIAATWYHFLIWFGYVSVRVCKVSELSPRNTTAYMGGRGGKQKSPLMFAVSPYVCL